MVRQHTVESLEEVVLSHVFVSTVEQVGNGGRKGHGRIYVVRDRNQKVILKVHEQMVLQSGKSASTYLAELLMSKVGCTTCGQPLLDGEEVTCGTCEAKQVTSLLRMEKRLRGA